MAKQILFICTGNTCRSPLAEGLLRVIAEKSGIDLDIRSAGVAAAEGMPISRHSSDILHEKGFVEAISSQSVTEKLVRWADIILSMTVSHKRAVVQQYPEAVDKIFTLKEYVQDDAETAALIKEKEELLSELHLKHALGQSISDKEVARLMELEKSTPDFDISDPFGGSKSEYEQCAAEIETCLRKLVDKLKQEPQE